MASRPHRMGSKGHRTAPAEPRRFGHRLVFGQASAYPLRRRGDRGEGQGDEEGSAEGRAAPHGIRLRGFKSFRDETRIGIRPLTLLAGANSSGKSSAIQPLLLLKQTLEVGYDPGPLLLDGPSVRFTIVDQMLWRGASHGKRTSAFAIGLSSGVEQVTLDFSRGEQGGVELKSTRYEGALGSYELRPGMADDELRRNVIFPEFEEDALHAKSIDFSVGRDRCRLTARASHLGLRVPGVPRIRFTVARTEPFASFDPIVRGIIHLPGRRGNPLRSYPTAQVDVRFPGLFQNYVASLVLGWKMARDERIGKLDKAFFDLGLTSGIDARPLDDTTIEIRVGRTPSLRKGSPQDLVNIADVGFGVSQILPVIVALFAAVPGQVVYLEEPEIHLHPRAQVALARLLLDAAKRGVIVIAETHSHLVLKEVQRAVAAGEADPSLVELHWFQRDEQGATKVSSAGLDPHGAYGAWPEDFADVELEVEDAFLRASMGRSA
jgi:AAA domain, putative AbiEii toxin, Type IV TA system